MLIVDLPTVELENMEQCIECRLRNLCPVYERWLHSPSLSIRCPKRSENLKECIIKGEIPSGHGNLIDKEKLMPSLKHISEAEHQIYGNASWRFAGKCIDEVDSAHVVVPTDKEGVDGRY